jgi:Uma2 family endonuclease
MAVAYKTPRFTVEEYHRMADAGVFDAHSRVELIRGELIEPVAPMKRPHELAIASLMVLLVRRLADRAYISCQTPVTLNGDSEPEPDFTIACLESRSAPRHPGPRDIFWLIEIADSTRDQDRRIKIPLFASAGVLEVWFVDLVDDVVVVYRDPQPDGYATALIVNRGESIAPLAFPDEHFAVLDMLPPDDGALPTSPF